MSIRSTVTFVVYCDGPFTAHILFLNPESIYIADEDPFAVFPMIYQHIQSGPGVQHLLRRVHELCGERQFSQGQEPHKD